VRYFVVPPTEDEPQVPERHNKLVAAVGSLLAPVTSRQDNFLYFEKKEFGIGRIWKDVSDVSLAD